MKLVTKYQISAINICWEKCYEKWAYMFNVYKNQQNRQTGSRNLMGPKTSPTIWGTYMKLVTKYQIFVINSCWEKCDEKWQKKWPYKRETIVYIWCPYGLGIELWCLMTLSTIFQCNRGGQFYYTPAPRRGRGVLGIWRVQKSYPQYGIPIWRLWPNIRFLPSTVPEKNATKNILDGRKDGQR
jgi:hypothetical protein